MTKTIGIDLGTSNSAASVMMGGKPAMIPSAEGTSIGGKAFPSYVAFTKEGQVLVGEPARRQAVTNPQGTVLAIKRKMGTDYKVKIQGKDYTPQQISSFILQKIKKDAEAFLGDKVEKAVITVPAYFNDNQRTATKDAGAIAGLEVIRIINEPTAAALAYGLDKGGKEQKVMIFDLGGGTLDVTIMEFSEGVFEVKSTSGDTQLGGTDMDNVLIDHIASEFKRESGIDVRNDKMAMQRLREAAEKSKIELSNVLETDVNLPFITADASGPKHLVMKITRAKLEELVRPIIDRCRQPLTQALGDAKTTPEKIDKVIFVGGPTRMPIVQRFVEETVGKKVERGVDPMECVAMGAAIQAGVLAGEVKDVVLLDVTPLSLGVETLGGVFTKLIDRNTTIPTRKSEIFSTAADGQNTVEIHVLQGERQVAGGNTTLGRFHLMGIPPAPRGIPKIEVAFDIDANGIMHVSAKDLATGNEQKITITASTKLSKDQISKMVDEAQKFADDDKKKMEAVETKNRAEGLVYSTEKLLVDLGGKMSSEEKEKINGLLAKLRESAKTDDTARIKTDTDELNRVLSEISTRIYQSAGAEYQQKYQQQQGGGKGGDSAGGQQGASEADQYWDAEGKEGGEGGGGRKSKKGGEDKDKTVDAEYKVVDEE
jgi:molecular chaperone DnaK